MPRRSVINGLILACVLLSACGQKGGLSITGLLTFHGQPVAGELSFERLGSDGKPLGRAVSANCDNDGVFATSLPGQAGDRFRIVVTAATSLEAQNTPASFDWTPIGPKSVTLERHLEDGQRLILAFTQ